MGHHDDFEDYEEQRFYRDQNMRRGSGTDDLILIGFGLIAALAAVFFGLHWLDDHFGWHLAAWFSDRIGFSEKPPKK